MLSFILLSVIFSCYKIAEACPLNYDGYNDIWRPYYPSYGPNNLIWNAHPYDDYNTVNAYLTAKAKENYKQRNDLDKHFWYHNLKHTLPSGDHPIPFVPRQTEPFPLPRPYNVQDYEKYLNNLRAIGATSLRTSQFNRDLPEVNWLANYSPYLYPTRRTGAAGPNSGENELVYRSNLHPWVPHPHMP